MEMSKRGLLKCQDAVVMGAKEKWKKRNPEKRPQNGLEYYPVNKACGGSKQQGEAVAHPHREHL